MSFKDIIITDKVILRFWQKVEKTNTCWLWKGAINPSGHGVLKIDGSNRGAHRISFTIHNGEIDEDMCICHKCHIAHCVNPNHLYCGTHQQNMQDEVKRKNTRHYKCANPTKFKGVRYDSSRQSWISYVYSKNKLIDIGRHISEIDAARNHDRIAFMRYGMKDDLNFPEEYNISD